MSGLTSLDLKTEYRKGRDDIAQEFYLPCMQASKRYDRAVGFFSSAIYIIAWPSLKNFVARNGRMRLVCSPVLSGNDIDAIEAGYSERVEASVATKLSDEIRYMLTTPYLHKPTAVLASLIALEVVDIKIAFMSRSPRHQRLFHDKLGIFHDEFGNAISFKGSMNETWAGLSADGNLESVDVFLSWEDERESNRVKENKEYFEELWENRYQHDGVIVKNFPDVARSDLVKAADFDRWPDLVDDICREIDAGKKYENPSRDAKKLRPHQLLALQNWEARGRRGILEHATGSGKTITAIAAIRDAFKTNDVPMVLVPSELLFDQWHKELSENLSDVRPSILRCGAGHVRWRNESLIAPWSSPSSAMPRIILSTMPTAATQDFQSALKQGSHLFLIADEVHRIGSPNHLQLLSMDTGSRLGLSATPRRSGDSEGTAKIFDYFNGIVPPPFTLQDAIKSQALTPYFYHVHSVILTDDEQNRWNDISLKIWRLHARRKSDQPDPNAEFQIKRLLIERARILKQAERKSTKAGDICAANYREGERWIVYCDDLEQLGSVRQELERRGIKSLEYHSAMSGDKEETLRLLEVNGGIVVSIRCLDEGVDIPSVTHALILASSKNPREYIQRRGRVLRRAEGKSVSYIHDVLVLPLINEENGDEDDPHINILRGEIVRSLEFGRSALNPAAITDLERIALRFSTDLKSIVETDFEEDEE